MTDKELSASIDTYFKEVFNANCPICHFQEGHNQQNIKICQDCALKLEFAGDVEIELISQYSKN
jgi:hypothetical protein